MKKSIIFILMALMVIQMASANLLGQHVVGTPDSGTLSNTYEVDGYVYGLRGSDHQFITQPLSSVQPTMYITMWLDDNNKELTLSLWNYNTSTWDVLGTMPVGTKISAQFSVNTTNHYDTITNVMRVRMAEANGVWVIDKFIVSSAGLVETIKRVEQVDWVDNVGSVTSIKKQTPTLNVLGTYYEVGDTAKAIAQISIDGQPINDAECFVSIYHPDDTTHIRNSRMKNIPNSDGLYVYDMEIPDDDESVGVWPVAVVCDFATESVTYYPMDAVYNWGTSSGNPTALWYDDEDYSHLVTEWDGLQDRIDVEIEYYNMSQDITQASRMFFEWQGYTDFENGYASVYFWDYDSLQWVLVSNQLESEFTQVSFEAVKALNGTIGKYVDDTTNNVKVKVEGNITARYEYIDFFSELFNYSAQALPDDGVTFGITTDEQIDDVNFSITSSETIQIKGTGVDPVPVNLFADDYLTEYGTIKYKEGVYEKLEPGEIMTQIKTDAGGTITEERRGFVRYIIPATPSGEVIKSATLYALWHEVNNNMPCTVSYKTISDWYPLDATDWNLNGTTMFTKSTTDTLDHVNYPFDVTSYVTAGTTFAYVGVPSRDIPGDAGECRLYMENDFRNYLLIEYESGSGYIIIPADSTTYDDLTLSYDRGVSGAENTDEYRVEISYNGGSSWQTVESWVGTIPYGTNTFALNSSYDNTNDILIRFYGQADNTDDILTVDNVKLNGNHRIYYNMFTDYIHLDIVNAVDVINEVRGGGEFNVKDRLNGIEGALSGLNLTLNDIFFSFYEIDFTMPGIYSPYDAAIVSIYFFDKRDNSGVTGATCSLNIYGPSNGVDQGPLVMSGYSLTEVGSGTYNAIPPQPINGWVKGIYKLEASCVKDGDSYYKTSGFRMEDKIYGKIADEVWMVNRTIEPGLLEQLSTNIWNFVSRYIHGEILN
jgi:hypothetical protein